MFLSFTCNLKYLEMDMESANGLHVLLSIVGHVRLTAIMYRSPPLSYILIFTISQKNQFLKKSVITMLFQIVKIHVSAEECFTLHMNFLS